MRIALLLALAAAACASAEEDAAPVGRAELDLRVTADLALVARGRIVARGAVDPRVGDDGVRIAYTELPAGMIEYHLGAPTRLVVLDLAHGTRRVVADHPLDSSPFPVPGCDDVLFVSGRTGVASLWLSSPGRPPRQLTNVGLRRVGPGFVPVPGRELSFDEGGRRAVYRTSYGGVRERWAVDLDTGLAERLEGAP